MEPLTPCPAQERLTAWDAGLMLPAELEVIELHIRDCQRCQRAMEELDGADPLTGRLRRERRGAA